MSSATQLTCPSAQPGLDGARIIGVVRRDGDGADVRVQTLARSLPVESLIHLVPAELRPTEVLRFGAPCAGDACAHFDGASCQLASRIVARLPVVVDALKPCTIRATCRWFHQERGAACRRCPQVVTEPYGSTELMAEVAEPSRKGAEGRE
jgi:hypothetical protein